MGIEGVQVGDDGEAAQQFGNQPESPEVLGIDVLQKVGSVHLGGGFDGVVAYGGRLYAAGYHLVYAFEGASADEQYVLGIDFDHFLLGMFAAALRGHQDIAAFQQFQ